MSLAKQLEKVRNIYFDGEFVKGYRQAVAEILCLGKRN